MNNEPNWMQHSQEEWFTMAGEAEEIMRRCGPMDPAYRIYKTNRDHYLEMAVMRAEYDLARYDVGL